MRRGAIRNHIRSLLRLGGALTTLATVTLLSTSASAQTVALNNTLTSAQAKKWSLPISVGTASNLYQNDAYEREGLTSFTLSPVYRLTDSLSLGAMTGGYQEETGARNSAFLNTSVSLSYKTALTETTTWKAGTRVILPTNRPGQDETSLQGGVGVSTGFVFDDLFLGSSFTYGISFTRYSHEFDRTASDTANVRETLSQSLVYSLPIGSRFTLEPSFQYTQGLTYQDDTRHTFGAGVELSFAATKALYFSVGTSNEGAALKPNGSDSNIEFFDDKTSVISVGITYLL